MRSPGTPGRAMIGQLKRRADFLRVAKGKRWHGTGLSLQVVKRADTGAEPAATPRVGFTLTKKVGCAVIRNRARRRLREAVRAGPDRSMRTGHDYVLVGRTAAVRLPFQDLVDELGRALHAVHAATRVDGGGDRPRGDGRHGRITPKP